MGLTGWKAPKIWKGSSCFIIGGGPSWLHQFNIPKELILQVRQKKKPMSCYSSYLRYLHDKHVIGVNGAFQLGSWISVCAFMDTAWYEEHEKKLLTQFAGLRVTTNDSVKQISYVKNHIKYLEPERGKVYGISNELGMCAQNGNSGAFAINVAYHLGVKKIYLLGFDMNIVAGVSHFHGEYQDPWTAQIIGTHLRCFPDIARDAKQYGLEIYNVNPDSAIDSFPKVTLDEVIRSEAK